MVNIVTHTNGVQSKYGLDPQKMQRPSSVAAAYGATTYWSSGSYGYDGSGNIKAIGSDYFYYDGVQRLVEGTSERVSSSVYKRQRQTYDVYGNITNIATTINGSTTNRSISVNSATNRLNNTSYDHIGNQLSWDGIYTYGYDSLGMMVSQQSSNRDILYIYTADDERVWEYDLLANRSDYTIRDLDDKVLRVFDENNGVWAWKKDMIHRGGAILGSSSPAGAYHYTVDHLGTPRYISNASRGQVGRHAYYPFGQESTSDTQNQEFLKFTGHERDTNFTGTLDYLDYMHARYYNPMLGRFLSVDPGRDWEPTLPQSWNSYGYVRNSPSNQTDSTGRWIDTAFDLTSLGYGIGQMWAKALRGEAVTWRDNAAVGADLASVFLPGVTGVGSAVRAANVADQVVDATKSAPEASRIIGMDEAVARAAAHVGEEVVMEATGKGLNYQFRRTSVNAASETETRIGRFAINPEDPHVREHGAHLNLETQVNGKVKRNEHIPIDPNSIRAGDHPR